MYYHYRWIFYPSYPVFASHEFISADLRYRMFSSYCRYKNNPTNINVAASHDDAPMIGTQFGPPLPSFHSLQSSGGMKFQRRHSRRTLLVPNLYLATTSRILARSISISRLIDSAFAGPITVGRQVAAVVPFLAATGPSTRPVHRPSGTHLSVVGLL